MAFTALFEAHFQAVYDYARWLSGDPSLADDLTQETFIRAHRHLAKLGPPWKLRAWLFRLTRNLLVDHTRRRRPTEPIETTMNVRSSGPSPERLALSAEAAARVRRAIQSLPPHLREALVLRELNGLAYGLDRVKVWIHRARSRFKDSYGVRLLVEEPLPECLELGALLDALHDQEDLAGLDRTVRKHLKSCDRCQQHKRELEALSALLGLLPRFPPPPGLAKRILKETLSTKRSPKGRRPRPGPIARRVFYVTMGISAAGLAVWALSLVRTPSEFPSPTATFPSFQATSSLTGPSSPTPRPSGTIEVLLDTFSPTTTTPGTIQTPLNTSTPTPGLIEVTETALTATPAMTLSSTIQATQISPTPPLITTEPVPQDETPTPTTTPAATETLTPTATPGVTNTPIPSNTPDLEGPMVFNVVDNPDPIFTSGNASDTTTISASVTDSGGVEMVELYYRQGSGKFLLWGLMAADGDGGFQTKFGPFGQSGSYEYRILASDKAGNTNCSTKELSACPGETLSVIIP
jgi:RNA polymerase sigma-70 factor, ECF subfamily